jgi:hypothetical protein
MTCHPGSNTRVPLLEQELLTLLKHMTLTLFYLLVLMLLNLFFLYSIFFVFLSIFFWPLCHLFFNLRLLITPLVSSNFSYNENMTHLSKEQTRFTEHDRQTLQDLFDITLRYMYYQNSFDT